MRLSSARYLHTDTPVVQQQQLQEQEHAGLALDAAPDSARKRAGHWLNSDLDLDAYRTSKRYKLQVGWLRKSQQPCMVARACVWMCSCSADSAIGPSRQLKYFTLPQDIASDLARGMCLEGGGGTGEPGSARPSASGCAAPAASTGSLPDSLMLGSAESSPVEGEPRRPHDHSQQQQQQAHCTPRSQSRTPGMPHAPSGGGGGVRRRPTPQRLYETLSLHPTSPSDPGLEGQLDLRKVSVAAAWQAPSRLVNSQCSRLSQGNRTGAKLRCRVPPLRAGHPHAQLAVATAQGRAANQPDGVRSRGKRPSGCAGAAGTRRPAGAAAASASPAAAAAAAAGCPDRWACGGPCRLQPSRGQGRQQHEQHAGQPAAVRPAAASGWAAAAAGWPPAVPAAGHGMQQHADQPARAALALK
jgi:hypothetical protein